MSMLPADWLISASHNILSLQFLWWKCYGIRLYIFIIIPSYSSSSSLSLSLRHSVYWASFCLAFSVCGCSFAWW